MQMREATLIWPPVSCYYGNNIKTTKCLKHSTFIPASLWSSQEISIPGNRRAHRGKQLCIWKAVLAAWTKMGVFGGTWRKSGKKHAEKKRKEIIMRRTERSRGKNHSVFVRRKFHGISFAVLTVIISRPVNTHEHVHVDTLTSQIFRLRLPLSYKQREQT